MKNLLDILDDILFHIFRHFIFSSGVEGLIRLETVCKRMREICLSRTCWIDALETLEDRPPFTTSRSSLLELSAADLRKEVTRAIKLDQSWKASGGPPITEEINIHHPNRRYERILPLPEVDLVFASYPGTRSGIHCWSISQKRLIWEHNISLSNEMSVSHGFQWCIEFDCDVTDDHSTVLVALLFLRNGQSGGWCVQVHQLDTRTFNYELLFESPPMSAIINGYIVVNYHDIRIRNHYIVLLTYNKDTSQAALIFMNWRGKEFFRINNTPNTKIGSSIALTQDAIFFICPVDSATNRQHRLVGIRYGDLAGSSACNSEDWTTFESADLQDRGVYSTIILERERPPTHGLRSEYCQFWMTAIVTTWLRTPTTRISVTFNEMASSREDSGISIFDVAFTLDGAGHGLFKAIHLYSKVLRPMTFLTIPSAAMRAVIRPIERERATTFAVIVNADSHRIIDTERIHPLLRQSLTATAGVINTWKAGMDSRGRMMVYLDDSIQRIVIIRFD